MAFNTQQPAFLRLRDIHSERRKPIVFWTGAGLSMPAKLPSWPGLRDELIRRALETLVGLPKADAAHREAQLELAKVDPSLWDAFKTLKAAMGPHEFREEIREVLSHATEAEVPDAYRLIWELPGVRGMLTLNLDEFALKSHKRTRLSEDVVSFVGRDASDYTHILGKGRPFIANLHGVIDAQKSWIFTTDEVSSLITSVGYRAFIAAVFSQMSVVFIGISAEDASAGGFLDQLTKSGVDLGEHFWITDRTDPNSRAWAGEAGLGIIRYTPVTSDASADHTQPITELLTDIKEYVSKDAPLKPLVPNVAVVPHLDSPGNLLSDDVDAMRTKLSGYAKYVLESEEFGRDSKYAQFLNEYGRCIHQAWWLTSTAPDNVFYGYTVDGVVAQSPFSTVWRLKGYDGKDYALKVLEIRNLHKGPEIESFRRGTQSLGFLTAAGVPGTPALKVAFEIPTAVVMDFVEGNNLAEIVETRSFKPWDDGLAIMEKVCEHLRYGHNLPQGVLHRDVRPSNIMVPYFFWQPDFLQGEPPEKHEVKLLNYDMSWHSKAKGQAISGNLQESGYYAPEHASAEFEHQRSTLVDSYGLGMCLYFAFTKSPPPPGGSKSTDWQGLLDASFRAQPKHKWRSAGARMRRLIDRATSPVPNERPVMDQIAAELRTIRLALAGTTTHLTADMWAEELISQAEEAEYVSDINGVRFTREPRAGRTITVEGDLQRNRVVVSFKNQALPSTNRSNLDRIWSEKLQRAREVLTSSGWKISDRTSYGNMEILLSAEVDVEDISTEFQRYLSGLKRGLDLVRIE
ncbi:SIR2 family protein [Brevundimonas sp. PAMC22021]|uniref:protein kinase domain-containing protein n=1 Tax=Brevundimonas sp. PAMC22021 TaxID=2861285 RepID=UPI001C627690|nr:SIR2 family protein [Brevundimonas sp. PAMC22021]QYF86574.1 SIR2 family protein [Brevundimonas sp. PAMC22021]